MFLVLNWALVFPVNCLYLWNEFEMYQTLNFKENTKLHLEFLSSIVMTVGLFTCQTGKLLSHQQLWCVPWIWNEIKRDLACRKWLVLGTVFKENSTLNRDLLSLCIGFRDTRVYYKTEQLDVFVDVREYLIKNEILQIREEW